MTDKEKFYKLVLNIITYEYSNKGLVYINGALRKVIIELDLDDYLTLKTNGLNLSLERGQSVVSVNENNISELDNIIDYLRRNRKRRILVKGIK